MARISPSANPCPEGRPVRDRRRFTSDCCDTKSVTAALLSAAVTATVMFYCLSSRISPQSSLQGVSQPRITAETIQDTSITETSAQTGTATPSITPTLSNAVLHDADKLANTPPPSPTPSPAYQLPVCKRMSPWADICVYSTTCWDGSTWWILLPNGDRNRKGRVEYEKEDLTTGYLYPRLKIPDPSKSVIPFNGGGMTVRRLHPDVLMNNDLKVTWFNGTFWKLPISLSIENPWYVTARTMALYRARMMNATGWFHPPLPSLGEDDMVFLGATKLRWGSWDWAQNVLALVTGDGDWNKQWNPDNVVCFKRMVATGTVAPALPDLETAFKFREDIYKMVGVQLPDKPAKKVLFWLRRPHQGRGLLNADELIDVAKSYNISYTVVIEFPKTMKEQLELFASHGVIVSPHGAGLMNAAFLAPFSSVIELFPYHLDHNLYPTVATTAGLGYYPVHSYNGTDIWKTYKDNFELECEGLTSIEMNYEQRSLCRLGPIYYKMKVSVRDFEAALVNAVNHAGYRLYFRDMKPTRDDSTLTGWK